MRGGAVRRPERAGGAGARCSRSSRAANAELDRRGGDRDARRAGAGGVRADQRRARHRARARPAWTPTLAALDRGADRRAPGGASAAGFRRGGPDSRRARRARGVTIEDAGAGDEVEARRGATRKSRVAAFGLTAFSTSNYPTSLAQKWPSADVAQLAEHLICNQAGCEFDSRRQLCWVAVVASRSAVCCETIGWGTQVAKGSRL